MIISHQKKFVYIAIPKTGSTSIRKCLHRWTDLTGDRIHRSLTYHHVTGRRLNELFVKRNWKWEKYYKFTFVRNPFSKIVSQYFYMIKCAADPRIKKYDLPFYKNCVFVKEHAKSFADFIKKQGYFSGMFDHDQTKWITDDFDYVGKMETLQQDFDNICADIGLPNMMLPMVNTTRHNHYTSYYDDESREIVERLFNKTIEQYNYKFGE